MTEPEDVTSLIRAFATGADPDDIVAVPLNVPKHDESEGDVTATFTVALLNTSAGPL
jgi:hypothetical protein